MTTVCHKSSQFLPSPARPVTGLGLGTGVVAVVSCPEVLAPARDVLLDLHVGVTEPDDLLPVPVLDAHSGLLVSFGCTPRFVQWLVFVWTRHG